MRIIFMVAGNLIRTGLYPLGLLRSLGVLPHPAFTRHAAGEKSSDPLR
jgi:hypothetical protein